MWLSIYMSKTDMTFRMENIPYLCILITLALFPTIARPESTSNELDEVLRKLEELKSTQTRQMQQMQLQPDDMSQRMTSTEAELNLIKSSVVQGKALLFKSFHIR